MKGSARLHLISGGGGGGKASSERMDSCEGCKIREQRAQLLPQLIQFFQNNKIYVSHVTNYDYVCAIRNRNGNKQFQPKPPLKRNSAIRNNNNEIQYNKSFRLCLDASINALNRVQVAAISPIRLAPADLICVHRGRRFSSSSS